MVHTLMFYDLERPAPVYGNDDFHFLYDFIAQEAPRRRIRYFPEAAYWLTFDIAVPLYLPITIEARDRDIQRLRPLLQTDWSSDHGVDGHHTFGSGHEWGYWQNEYCSLRMSMDVEYRYRDCLADIAQPLGPAAASEVVTIIDELITLEARDLMTGWEDTLAYLVGTDPETEIAASVGVVFHPLPPTPATMMTWDLETIRAWRARHEPALMRMDTEYGALAARLEALTPMVAAEGRPIFDEILDGVSVTGLRARHAWQAYGAVAAKREADLTNDAALATTAHDRLEAATATTARARQIIARRESEYRYAPLSRSIAGGEDFDEDQNWTVYRYRYLARTHWAYYWTRVDRSVDEVLTGGSSAVRIADVMLEPGRDLSIEVLEAELAMVSIDFGDGSPTSSERSVTHAYASPDVYSLAISATRGTDTFSLAGDVAELTSELHTAFTGRVVEPAGVALIEGVLPALVIGSIDATRTAVGFSAKATGEVELGLFTVVAPDTTSTAHLATLPARFDVPIVNRGTGTVSASILVEDGVVTQQTPTSPIVLAGQLSTDAVVEAVVSIGAFDRDGARRILASTLGYTPSTLPASVAFRVEFEMP